MKAPASDTIAAEGISRDEKQRELQALLRSGIVREHTGLHALLTYLGSRALANGGEPPKEYTIGVEALGKPADYDPRIDPTVRVDIGKLRAKLRDHYQKQGASSAVQLEIPRGHYHLVYSRVSQRARGRPVAAVLWAGVAMAAIGLGLGFVAGRATRPASTHVELSPELRAFWAPFIRGNAPVLISYGTPLFLKLDRAFYRDPRVNRPEDAEGLADFDSVLLATRPTERRWVINYTGVGEAEGVFAITRLLASQGVRLEVQRSSNLSWEDMKGKHAILLGSHKFNAQIRELPVQAKFQAASQPSRIVNLKPGPGETADYKTVTSGPNGEILEEYAVVSVFRGFTHDTRLLVLACSSSEGTGAAAEYVTRTDTLRELLTKMGVSPTRPVLPEAFQIVIRAQMKGGVPVRLSYQSHHVLLR